MTDDELKTYYANLLIIQYIGKSKARDTIKAQVEPIIMNQLPVTVQNSFNLETAAGVQLDVLGKYAGVSRNGYDFSGPITLDDSDFRSLIKLAIVKNGTGSSLADIQNLLFIFFPGSFLVFDYKNMHMSYIFDSAFGSRPLAEMFVRNGLLPKPMGVLLGALIYAPNITNFFGFRTYELPGFNVTGFNHYDGYTTDTPWLKYSDAIVVT